MLRKYTTTTLNISSAHIRPETDRRFHAHAAHDFSQPDPGSGFSQLTRGRHFLTALPLPGGWRFVVDGYQATAAQEVELPELAALILFAAMRGFAYLEIDNYHEPLPPELGFPVFEW